MRRSVSVFAVLWHNSKREGMMRESFKCPPPHVLRSWKALNAHIMRRLDLVPPAFVKAKTNADHYREERAETLRRMSVRVPPPEVKTVCLRCGHKWATEHHPERNGWSYLCCPNCNNIYDRG